MASNAAEPLGKCQQEDIDSFYLQSPALQNLLEKLEKIDNSAILTEVFTSNASESSPHQRTDASQVTNNASVSTCRVDSSTANDQKLTPSDTSKNAANQYVENCANSLCASSSTVSSCLQILNTEDLDYVFKATSQGNKDLDILKSSLEQCNDITSIQEEYEVVLRDIVRALSSYNANPSVVKNISSQLKEFANETQMCDTTMVLQHRGNDQQLTTMDSTECQPKNPALCEQTNNLYMSDLLLGKGFSTTNQSLVGNVKHDNERSSSVDPYYTDSKQTSSSSRYQDKLEYLGTVEKCEEPNVEPLENNNVSLSNGTEQLKQSTNTQIEGSVMVDNYNILLDDLSDISKRDLMSSNKKEHCLHQMKEKDYKNSEMETDGGLFETKYVHSLASPESVQTPVSKQQTSTVDLNVTAQHLINKNWQKNINSGDIYKCESVSDISMINTSIKALRNQNSKDTHGQCKKNSKADYSVQTCKLEINSRDEKPKSVTVSPLDCNKCEDVNTTDLDILDFTVNSDLIELTNDLISSVSDDIMEISLDTLDVGRKIEIASDISLSDVVPIHPPAPGAQFVKEKHTKSWDNSEDQVISKVSQEPQGRLSSDSVSLMHEKSLSRTDNVSYPWISSAHHVSRSLNKRKLCDGKRTVKKRRKIIRSSTYDVHQSQLSSDNVIISSNLTRTSQPSVLKYPQPPTMITQQQMKLDTDHSYKQGHLVNAKTPTTMVAAKRKIAPSPKTNVTPRYYYNRCSSDTNQTQRSDLNYNRTGNKRLKTVGSPEQQRSDYVDTSEKAARTSGFEGYAQSRMTRQFFNKQLTSHGLDTLHQNSRSEDVMGSYVNGNVYSVPNTYPFQPIFQNPPKTCFQMADDTASSTRKSQFQGKTFERFIINNTTQGYSIKRVSAAPQGQTHAKQGCVTQSTSPPVARVNTSSMQPSVTAVRIPIETPSQPLKHVILNLPSDTPCKIMYDQNQVMCPRVEYPDTSRTTIYENSATTQNNPSVLLIPDY